MICYLVKNYIGNVYEKFEKFQTEYEKLTKPPENENMTEIIETEFTRQISIR